MLQWHAARAAAAQPALEHTLADLLGRLGGEVEQDLQLGPVVQVVGQHRKRLDGEHLAELLVGEAEALHELCGRRLHGPGRYPTAQLVSLTARLFVLA